MSISSGKFLELQLEALSVRYFIIKYDELEKKIKQLFDQNISKIDTKNLNLLYFYFTGIKSNNVYCDFEHNSLKMDIIRFSEEERFAQFTMNQIIKIQRKQNLLNLFDFRVQSINRKTTTYPFTDCCIKIIAMRNKLAHEMSSLAFKDKEIIELLSDEYIKNNSEDWFGTLDTGLMNNNTKCIFSNLIILIHILDILNKLED